MWALLLHLMKAWSILLNVFFFFLILQFVFLSLSVYFGFSVGKGGKKPFKLVEKPELKPLLKVLLGSMCLLADCQWKCKRGEVSRLAVFCSLLFRLTLSGWPLRPVIQVVCSLRRPLPSSSSLSPFTSAAPCPQTRLASAASSLCSGVFLPPITWLCSYGHIGVSQWTTPVFLRSGSTCQS